MALRVKLVVLGWAVALPCSSASAWDHVLQSRVDGFLNGWEPTCTRAADFNEDGLDDLVTCITWPPSIVVNLRSENDDFYEHVRFGLGDYPYRMHVDDFDGDGHTDLVVSDTGLDCLHILMGRGNGTFWPATRIVTANNPWEIKSADLNEDGYRDLMVSVSGDGGHLFVLFGDGRGGFPTSSAFPVGPTPWPVQVADFDKDGHEDVAVGSMHGQFIAVMLGDGAGNLSTVASLPTTGEPRAMSVGLFDGDNLLDMAVSTAIPGVGARTSDTDGKPEGDVVIVYRALGAGQFETYGEYPGLNLPFHMITSDFSGDGQPDLGVLSWHESTLSVLVGHGDGTFADMVHHGTVWHPTWLEEVELNADGRMDYVVNGFCAGEYGFHFGRHATLADDISYPVGNRPRGIAAGDFDGDGLEDLALVNQADGTVSLLSGAANGLFSPIGQFSTGDNPYSIVALSLNEDSHDDLAVVSWGARDVRLYVCNGDGTFDNVNEIYLGQRPEDGVAANLNGDVHTDLIVGNSYGGRIHVLLGQGGGAFAAPSYYLAGSDVKSVCAVDVNGDGRDDAAAVSEADGLVTAFINDGSGTLAQTAQFTIVNGDGGPINSTGCAGIASGDFNEDAFGDLAVVSNRGNYFDGRVALFLGNGDGTFQAGPVYDANEIVRAIVITDLNNDLHDDIVVSASATHNSVSDGLTVFLGLGDGTFRNGHKFASGARRQLNKPYDVVAGDWNDDGYVDLASASYWTNMATVHLNWGDGPAVVHVADEPQGVAGVSPTVYPNPARMADRIRIGFAIDRKSNILIFDVSGRLVRSLDRTLLDEVVWDLRDGHGQSVAAGVYYVVSDGTSEVRGKLVVMP